MARQGGGRVSPADLETLRAAHRSAEDKVDECERLETQAERDLRAAQGRAWDARNDVARLRIALARALGRAA